MIDRKIIVQAAMATWFGLACSQSAVAQVTVTAGRILSGRVDVMNPPAAPKVSLDFAGVAAEVDFAWQGPSGEPFYQIFYGGTYTGTTTFQGRADDEDSSFSEGILGMFIRPFPGQVPNQEAGWSLYAEPGFWRLTGLRICQDLRNCTAYDSTSLAALFPRLTFNLVNPGTADIVAPSVRFGVIETRSISLASGAPARVFLSVSDAVSGVGTASVCATNATGTGSFCMSTIAPVPIHAGPVVPAGTPFPMTPTGTYTVTSIVLRDVAGNLTTITDPSTIDTLFNNHATVIVQP